MLYDAYGSLEHAQNAHSELMDLPIPFTADDVIDADSRPDAHDDTPHAHKDPLLDSGTRGSGGDTISGGIHASGGSNVRRGIAVSGGSNSGFNVPVTPPTSAGDDRLSEELKRLTDIGKRELSMATDAELIEWCETHAINITFIKDFWPRERSKGPWVGQVIDTGKGSSPTTATVSFSHPKPHTVNLLVSTGTLNLRSAIAHTYPSAKHLSELITSSKPQTAKGTLVSNQMPKRECRFAARDGREGDAMCYPAFLGQAVTKRERTSSWRGQCGTTPTERRW
jgi:hypothetical protein